MALILAVFGDKSLPGLCWDSPLLPIPDALGGTPYHLCFLQEWFPGSILLELGVMLCLHFPTLCPGSYRPSYEEMLRFYSYYKQATMGPCLVPRPGFWDPIGRYKW